VRFAFELFGKSPARFSLAERRLDTALGSATGLRPATTEAEGLAITNWQDSYSPILNGKPLQLLDHERSRSLAIAPDGQRFLLGTKFSIHLLTTVDKSSGTFRPGSSLGREYL